MRDTVSRTALTTILPCLIALLLIAAALPATFAQTQPPAAFGAQAQESAASAFAPPSAPAYAQGPFGAFMNWVTQTQQSMQKELAASVKRLKDGNALAAVLALAGISFVYGCLLYTSPS